VRIRPSDTGDRFIPGIPGIPGIHDDQTRRQRMSTKATKDDILAVRCATAELRVEALEKELEAQTKWNSMTAESYAQMRDKLDKVEEDKKNAVLIAEHGGHRRVASESTNSVRAHVNSEIESEKLKEEVKFLSRGYEKDREYICVLEWRLAATFSDYFNLVLLFAALSLVVISVSVATGWFMHNVFFN
jgi:hypothetical protein